MQTVVTTKELATIGTIVGGVLGLLIGLVPFFMGRKRGQAKLGLVGLAACIVGGLLAGLLLVLPIAALFVWLIFRKSSEGGAMVSAEAAGTAEDKATEE